MLYICATPIGNLEDITIRTLNVLKSVDYIICEDTRRTLKLLNHYMIKKKLISMNEHTEFYKKDQIIDDLQSGKNIALVSDAGMPLVQDPGQILLQKIIDNNIPYTVLPGPSALITALVGSGLNKDEFLFLGFLPRKQNERLEILNKYKNFSGEIILYEAPHRLSKLLKDILVAYGNRSIVIAREISKKFEEYDHTTIKQALMNKEFKGELVLIIKRPDEIKDQQYSEYEIQMLIDKLFTQRLHTKQIVQELVQNWGLTKNKAYELVINHMNR